MDATALKRRLAVMFVIDLVCFGVAGAAIYGFVARNLSYLGPVFVAAIAAGVAAQVWFIVAFARSGGADPQKA